MGQFKIKDWTGYKMCPFWPDIIFQIYTTYTYMKSGYKVWALTMYSIINLHKHSKI